MQQTSTVLKGYFQTGATPTQDQFGDLIDTIFALFNAASAQAQSVTPSALLQASWNGTVWTINSQINVTSIVGNPSTGSTIVFATPYGNANYLCVGMFQGLDVPVNATAVRVMSLSQTTAHVVATMPAYGNASIGDAPAMKFSMICY
ncbi:MAG TPA: hypothetical protein VHB20_14705 [Verrucomicrobiae bacterium]|jgi:hypothetical protein|nr:hypothetical protein [Verrucomicrobiae bacterium]